MRGKNQAGDANICIARLIPGYNFFFLSLYSVVGIWMISRDESRSGYQVFYYDDRQVSRIYAMSFENGGWKMLRESPGFSQRYEGQVSADGNAITAHWEKSNDGLHWEHDFDVKYTRVM